MKDKLNIKIIAIILVLILMIVTIVMSSFFINKKGSNNISFESNPVFHDLYSEEKGKFEYFLYNNKIYYTDINTNKSYIMNEDGTSKKELPDTFDLRKLENGFIYNNYFYYYDTFSIKKNFRNNKKMNLDTGNIEDIDCDGLFITDSLKDNKIYAYQKTGDGVYSTLKFFLYDIEKNESTLLSNYDLKDMSDFLIDYEKEDIYYAIKDYKGESNGYNHKIYKNNEFIEEIIDYDKYYPRLDIISVDNNYLYYIDDGITYKLDMTTKTSKSNSSGKIEDHISFDNIYNEDTIFYSNFKLLLFNNNSGNFKVMIDGVPEVNHPKESKIYTIGSKIIYSYKCENFSYYEDFKQNIGMFLVYDKDTKEIKRYDNVLKFSIESDNSIKMVTYENDAFMYKKIYM